MRFFGIHVSFFAAMVNISLLWKHLILRQLPSLIRIVILRLKGAKIGRRTLLGRAKFRIPAENIRIGDGAVIDNNVSFDNVSHVEIKDYVKIREGVRFVGGNRKRGRISIGHNSNLQKECFIDCNDDVIIGNNVGIGMRSQIWTHGAYLSTADGYPNTVKKVQIGSDVLINPGSALSPGVVIGDSVIVGTNSVVTRNVSSGTFVQGNPAQVLLDREGMFRRGKSPEKKISYTIDSCVDHLPDYRVRVKPSGENVWECCFLFRSFHVSYIHSLSVDQISDARNCIFTWEKIPDDLAIPRNTTVFVLSNNTYTKQRTLHEWLVIRSLLDSNVLKFCPLDAN